MNWHVYEISPIDFRWEYLSTIKQVACSIVKGANEYIDQHLDLNVTDLNVTELQKFIDSWETAKRLAVDKGWEGDFREDPRVFWVPSEGCFDYGFAFKQDNNGTTYVISPIALPHLQE